MTSSISSLRRTAGQIFEYLLDVVAPARRSEALVRTLTPEMLQKLVPDGNEPLPYHTAAVTALVWELKYRANPRAAALAGEFLAEQLLSIAAEELGKPLLIPVPMHATRRAKRGYNQTELLCETALRELLNETTSEKVLGSPPLRLGERSGGQTIFGGSFVFDYAPDILVRTRETPPQQGLPKRERLKNVKYSMKVNAPQAWRVAGRVCVVVDDVTTTGATLDEATRALREAGARAVHCIALARS